MVNLAELREEEAPKASKFITERPALHGAAAYLACRSIKADGEVLHYKNYGTICHSFLPSYRGDLCGQDVNRTSDVIAFSAGFSTAPQNQHKLEAFWGYLTSHQPWSTFLARADLLMKDGEIRGWTISPYTLGVYGNDRSIKLFNRLKHLAILSRFPMEKPNILDMWYDLVSKGFSPHDALLLSHAFRKDFGVDKYIVSTGEMQGSHSAFTLAETDYRYYARGTVDSSYCKSLNGIFRPSGEEQKYVRQFKPMLLDSHYKGEITDKILKEDFYARFFDGFKTDSQGNLLNLGVIAKYRSSEKRFTLDEIVDIFEDWQKDNY